MAVSEFLITKEYRRFEEFCNACHREKYIGICHGSPSVGKTLSASYYSKQDGLERFFNKDTPDRDVAEISKQLIFSRSIFYTPPVRNTARRIERDLEACRFELFSSFHSNGRKEASEGTSSASENQSKGILVIIDEADRLQLKSLEQVRAIYDERGWGIILIGIPGLEKRLARYPQLYSRIGFAHEYCPIGEEEMLFILEHHWEKLGLKLHKEDFSDTEAVAAIIRITNGNFRLVHRLFSQIKRIMNVNKLSSITKEVVEIARDCLVIGNV